MSFARGRYGVEYNPVQRGGDSHPFRWVLFVFALVAIVSFLCARGCRKNTLQMPDQPVDAPSAPLPQPPKPSPDKPARPNSAEKPSPATSTKTPSASPSSQNKPNGAIADTGGNASTAAVEVKPKKPVSSKAVQAAERWLETARTRTPEEATLLARLADAERLGNKRIVRDTLEKLRRRNAMADLDDPFARRLGVLNAESLFAIGSKERDGWTTTITVKRGDNAQRIAREHGTTLAAVLKLNALKDANRIRIGDQLRVLEFPRAELVVHASLRIADLSLNKRFFKRYDVSLAPEPKIGAYPITREEGPMDRFNALGLKFFPADRDEIALLLAPGARIIVSPQ